MVARTGLLLLLVVGVVGATGHSSALIATHDISKMWQRRRPPAQTPAPPGPGPGPGAAPLRARGQHSPGGGGMQPTAPGPPQPPTGAPVPGSSPGAGAGLGAARVPGERRAAVVPGAVVLGGLVSVHERGAGPGGCGPLRPREGVQALEALLWALDRAQALAPPGVTLGAHVLDDCDSDRHGLDAALDFIKGSIGNIEGAQSSCAALAPAPAAPAGPTRKVISGVVGAASSLTSAQVANLLRLFKIPQVSYYATSPELSNKARFEYLSRTVPSDAHQARALAGLVRRAGWTYVSVLYEDTHHGIKAFEELESLLAQSGVCIAVKERLARVGDEAAAEGADTERHYDGVVARLLARHTARGVILLSGEREAAGVLGAVARRNASRALAWLAGAGWSAREAATRGHEAAAAGALGVRPRARPLPGFRDYFLNLTVENNRRNPWFVEFWEDQFGCRHAAGEGGAPGGARGRGRARAARAPCSGRERLRAEAVQFEPQLQFVADAVLAFAHAIRALHAEVCGAGVAGVCAAMRAAGAGGAGGAALLRHLRAAAFTGLAGDEFQFDANGDGPARYDVVQYGRGARGEWRWVRVGRYAAGRLRVRTAEAASAWLGVRSECSLACAPGQARQYAAGERCCWRCYNCTQYEVVSVAADSACEPCAPGAVPDARRQRCQLLPARHERPGAHAALALAAAGAGLTALAAAVGAWRRTTPAAHAGVGGRALAGALLAGLALCQAAAAALLVRPSDARCAAGRAAAGLGPALAHAALLVKARGAGPGAAGAVGALAGVQAALLGAWQASAPARALRLVAARERVVLACDSLAGAGAGAGGVAAVPGLLLACAAVCAVRGRGRGDAWGEARHVALAAYSSCVAWLAAAPLYLATAAHVPLRATCMAVALSLSATATLVCVFGPKVYIMVWRPERNVPGGPAAARWRGAGAAGAVCAALVGAPSLRAPASAARVGPGPGPGPARPPAPRTHHRLVQTEPEVLLCARRLAPPPAQAALPPFARRAGAGAGAGAAGQPP